MAGARATWLKPYNDRCTPSTRVVPNHSYSLSVALQLDSSIEKLDADSYESVLRSELVTMREGCALTEYR